MIKLQTTDENEDEYADLIDDQSEIVGKIMSLKSFYKKYPKHEVFMEVTNNHCYRPGSVEKYTEINGRVFFLDELNEDEAIELLISKEELIKQYESVL